MFNYQSRAIIGFPREDRTECELEEWNECKAFRETNTDPYIRWSGSCGYINYLSIDDDCLGYSSLELSRLIWSFLFVFSRSSRITTKEIVE